jgi:RNA ligase (TIGR02306 family)
MSSRKLATIRRVASVEPIEGADKIEVATVDSWQVVVGKNTVEAGDFVVYFEIDSWIPTTLINLTRTGEPKKYNEVPGERLKTIKLRGVLSQGLIMNFEEISKVIPDFESRFTELIGPDGAIGGLDVTEILGIMKWELPSSMGSFRTKGNFPSFIPKTDQERIQNLTRRFDEIKKGRWEVTEKYDGSSMTVYRMIEDSKVYEGVCSRNLDLKMEAEDPKDPNEAPVINSFWEIAIREKLLEKIRESGLNVALQGELVGVKINNNIYKLTSRDFWLFDIYDIDAGRYYTATERQAFAEKYGIKHVPILFNDYQIPEDFTISDLLKFAEGPSVMNAKTEREGLVFKRIDREKFCVESFKAISNKYLLKNDG